MSSKRGADAAGSSDLSPGPAKRQRTSVEEPSADSSEDVATLGLRFIDQLKNSRDKSGREVAPLFLTLPDPGEYPDYYKLVKLPIAIDTVEAKLNKREYNNLTEVESDLKRMVKNAKDYNDRSSAIFADAERIRKHLSNYMVKHNPAYADKNYQAVPTPIPEEEDSAQSRRSVSAMDRSRVNSARSRSAARADSSHSSTPNPPNVDGGADTFDPTAFQRAQEGIITELLTAKDEDGAPMYPEFVNLPSRATPGYYQTIKYPVSLKAVEKKIRGVEGRKDPTGVSHFKTWGALEDEISFIWNNARTFNEEGSPIYVLADKLEEHFHRLFRDAKARAPDLPLLNGESSAPRIKLNVKDPSQKIKIRLGGQKGESEESQVMVDSASLQQQRNFVNAVNTGANGKNTPGREEPRGRNPFGGSSSSGPNNLPAIRSASYDRTKSESVGSPALSASAVKLEAPQGQTPLSGAAQLRKDSQNSDSVAPSPGLPATTNMPPPSSATPKLPSASPHPTQPQHAPHATSSLDSRLRQPGRDASSALIAKTIIETHPEIKVDKHFKYEVLPSPTHSQQSLTLTLPSTHYYLRITPIIGEISPNRQSKLVVSSNFIPIKQKSFEADPNPNPNPNPNQPFFDTRVLPGLNTINVEMIAGPPRGAPKSTPGQDLELERITIYIQLLKK